MEDQLLKITYCICRQAERSLDTALWSDWKEFIDYYQPRRGPLKEALASLKRQEAATTLSMKELRGKFWQALEHQDSLTSKLLNKFRKFNGVSPLSDDELTFIAEVISAFLSILAEPRPSREKVISLRMDFSICLWLLENKGLEHNWLKKAMEIEHFGSSRSLELNSMEQLIASESDGVGSKN